MRTLIVFLLLTTAAIAAEWPIVYCRTPRNADAAVLIHEVGHPHKFNAGTHLILRQPDGAERLLVDAGAGQAIDPYPDFKAEWVYYAYSEKDGAGSDIYKVNVASGEKVRLTNGERTQHTGWAVNNAPVYNLGPCPIPGGRVAFTSTRNMLLTQKGFSSQYANQLFLMDEDGKNVEQTGHLNLAGALHPTLLNDGKIMWSSLETQGRRDPRLWGLWASYPDGRHWEPLWSAFFVSSAIHFQTQRSDGNIVASLYYNAFNGGLGELLSLPYPSKGFGSPDYALNPKLGSTWSYPFQPVGASTLTPWTHGSDDASATGKVGHPSGAPDNAILVTYTPGPASTKVGAPFFDHGIYILRGDTTAGPDDLELVVNSPDWMEFQPRALVPWERIYGQANNSQPEPPEHPVVPNESCTPFGYIGTSSFYARESKAANEWGYFKNFIRQGGDSSAFENSEIHAVRILAQEPTSANFPPRDFFAVGEERVRVIGEVPLRKPGIVDAVGDPDTSFLAKIPADVSFTFQMLDADGLALTTAQTWHQVRPGEKRTDCRGCHAHHKPGIEFEGAAASKPDYTIADLTKNKPWTVEYWRDIEPIFKRSCQPCHLGADAPKGLVLDEKAGLHGDWGMAAPATITGYAARGSKLFQHLRAGIMPPPDSTVPRPTPEEIQTVGKWIDLGCQTDKKPSAVNNGIFADDSRPTLYVPRVFSGKARFGAFDYFSGLDETKTSVKLNGSPVTVVLTGDHVWTAEATPQAGDLLTVSVTDKAGHSTTVERFVREGTTPPPPARIPKAVYLGLDGDNVGPERQGTPDGKLDHHIKLSGLAPTYHRVNVHFGATKWSNEAEIPIVLGRPSIPGSPLGELDLWFAPRNGSEAATEFIVFILKADGTDERIVTTLPSNQQAVVDALQAEVARLLVIIQAVRDAVK